MSNIVKLGAKAVTAEMMADVTSSDRDRELSWHAGYYVGLFEAGMLTIDELDELTNNLRED